MNMTEKGFETDNKSKLFQLINDQYPIQPMRNPAWEHIEF